MIDIKLFPNSTRRCVVALGKKTDKFFTPSFPLTIIVDSAIQIISRILVHPILVDTVERVVGYLTLDFMEVCHAY